MNQILQIMTAAPGVFAVFEIDGVEVKSPIAFWALVETEDRFRYVTGYEIAGDGPQDVEAVSNFEGYHVEGRD